MKYAKVKMQDDALARLFNWTFALSAIPKSVAEFARLQTLGRKTAELLRTNLWSVPQLQIGHPIWSFCLRNLHYSLSSEF